MALLDWFRRKPPQTEQKGWVQTMEGALDSSWDWGWWQQDRKPRQYGMNATVEACISTLAQTAAMCPIQVLEESEDGSETRIYGTAAERVMQYPNPYETRSLFLVNLIRSVYYNGNAYAVAKRDENNAISELHLMNAAATRAVYDRVTQQVFYYASERVNQPGFTFDEDEDRIFPQRDVLHFRLWTGTDPLKGESAIQAAASAISANTAIVGHQSSFFNNMTRPAGILSSDSQFTADQMAQLRQAWEKQSKGINSGGVPILGGGLKWQPLSLSNEDSQLVESYGLTTADISRVFRVPLPLINDMTGSTFNNVEALMSFFLSNGLGFLVEHLEMELTRFFRLPPRRKIHCDTGVLLRMDQKSKVDAYGEGVAKGIFAPNEARRKFGLGPVEGGDQPRVQQQMVPLDMEPEPTPQEVEASIRSYMRGAA